MSKIIEATRFKEAIPYSQEKEYDFEGELAYRVLAINEAIEDYLPSEEGYARVIMEAMNYSVRAGGKRLRPILMSEMFKTFGGRGRYIEPFMVAMECVHTYSLVHDDLPAMDNDELRRGKPTTWKEYGEDMGILAGDALLNYAYEVLSFAMSATVDNMTHLNQDSKQSLTTEEITRQMGACAKAFYIFTQKAGIYGMIGGQVADVLSDGKEIDDAQMRYIHENKTCALIEASLMIGAILGGATTEEVDTVCQIGTNLGMAFQIRDDILDVTASTETLGKPVGSDKKNEKNTYVSRLGLEGAAKAAEDYLDAAIELFVSLDRQNVFFMDLMLYLTERNK